MLAYPILRLPRPGLQAELEVGRQTSHVWLWSRRLPRPETAQELPWGLSSEPRELARLWPEPGPHRVRRLVLRLPPGEVQSVQVEAPRQLSGAALERHIQSRLQAHLGNESGPYAYDYPWPERTGQAAETARQLQVFAVPWRRLSPVLHALAFARLPLHAIRPAMADVEAALHEAPSETDTLLARWGDPGNLDAPVGIELA